MFKSLRSRLLVSYIVIITAVLVVTAVTLFLFATRPTIRYLPALQRLITVSQSQRREVARLRESGANLSVMAETLALLAEDNDIRILLLNPNNQRILYDSGDNWTGDTLTELEPISLRLLPVTDQSALFGRFRGPIGGRWLAYSPTAFNAAASRVQLLYIQPEPTALSFFREFFLRPLLGAGGIAFLLAIILALAIAASVARPLQKMALAAEAVADGDYDQELSPGGPEEVQRVANSFNSMAVQVKMTQKAQQNFVANVSHDLKTPITSIRGWSQSLLDGTAVTTGQQRQAAEIIHKEADRMSRMVSQLLDLARIESGQLELVRAPVDLRQVMADVRHNLALRAAEAGIHLTLEETPVPSVLGDYDRLVQVFTNLVDNALSHTASGGRVHLQVRSHGEKAVEGAVQDTGQGIPPEELSRIFERFYQVDKSRARAGQGSGSGLGLAIVQELVEAHHGRIQARSQVGEGSVFIVRLPTTDEPEASTFLRRNS